MEDAARRALAQELARLDQTVSHAGRAAQQGATGGEGDRNEEKEVEEIDREMGEILERERWRGEEGRVPVRPADQA